MCDTMIALAGASLERKWTLFAKNSDREWDEPQHLLQLPRRRHAHGTRVRMTHVEIDQVPETAAVLLSKPFWMWGAEMGANEHGVVIGNEAVHGTVPASLEPGVLGMDLLRLGLERSRSAGEALDVMIALLERHGQGGDCSRTRPRTYNNSFIIADAHEAWVLETLGRHWISERVDDVRSISNTLTIGVRHDRAALSLRQLANQRGLSEAAGTVDFAAVFRAPDQRRSGVVRFERSSSLMRAQAGRATLRGMLAVLRDHGEPANAEHRLPRGEERGHTICMHPVDGEGLRGQTAGSWVSQLSPHVAVHWVTATAAPCLGVFKPVFPDCELPDQGPVPDEHEPVESRWWWHEKVFRPAIESDPGQRLAYQHERDALEREFEAQVLELLAGGPASSRGSRGELVRQCWAEADALQRRWSGQPAGRCRDPGVRALAIVP